MLSIACRQSMVSGSGFKRLPQKETIKTTVIKCDSLTLPPHIFLQHQPSGVPTSSDAASTRPCTRRSTRRRTRPTHLAILRSFVGPPYLIPEEPAGTCCGNKYHTRGTVLRSLSPPHDQKICPRSSRHNFALHRLQGCQLPDA